MDEEIHKAIHAIGADGRLIFLPSMGVYRTGETTVEVPVASKLLRRRFMEPADGRAGVYKLSAAGLAVFNKLEEAHETE